MSFHNAMLKNFPAIGGEHFHTPGTNTSIRLERAETSQSTTVKNPKRLTQLIEAGTFAEAIDKAGLSMARATINMERRSIDALNKLGSIGKKASSKSSLEPLMRKPELQLNPK